MTDMLFTNKSLNNQLLFNLFTGIPTGQTLYFSPKLAITCTLHTAMIWLSSLQLLLIKE